MKWRNILLPINLNSESLGDARRKDIESPTNFSDQIFSDSVKTTVKYYSRARCFMYSILIIL